MKCEGVIGRNGTRDHFKDTSYGVEPAAGLLLSLSAGRRARPCIKPAPEADESRGGDSDSRLGRQGQNISFSIPLFFVVGIVFSSRKVGNTSRSADLAALGVPRGVNMFW